jgi:hypothetical protein
MIWRGAIGGMLLTLGASAAVNVSDPQDVAPVPVRERPAPPAPKPAAPPPAPVTPIIETPVPRDGLVRFRNGDRLHGELVGIDRQGMLHWRHADAAAPLSLAARNVTQIMFPAPGPAPTARGAAVVTLTNGDQLRGELVGLDAERLTLDTWYAGRLPILRTMVRQLSPAAGMDTLVYEGPNNLDGWQRGGQPEAWQWRAGALTAQGFGSIGRDVGLPERAVVEFDLSWVQWPQLQIGLYGRRANAMPGENEATGYWLSLIGTSAQLQRVQRGETTQLGAVEMRKTARGNHARVAIFADAKEKTITLCLDGQVVRTWTDPRDFAGTGPCLTFSSHIGGGNGSRIRHLTVRHWVGDLDTGAPVRAVREDILSLANNDRVAGQLTRIENANATIRTGEISLAIPVSRIAVAHFASATAERARRMSGDVLAVFHDGTRVTFALQEATDKTWDGESENFGAARFARSAFREIHFQIYDEDRGEELNLERGDLGQWLRPE